MITLPAASEAAAAISQLTGMLVRTTRPGEPGDLIGLPNWTATVRKAPLCTAKDVQQWWQEALLAASGTGTLPLLLYRRTGNLQWTAGWPAALYNPDLMPGPGETHPLRRSDLRAWLAYAQPTFTLVLD